MPLLKFISNRTFQEEDLHRYDRFLIEVNDVTKSYETEAGDFLALKRVNLAIGKGEFVGVIGKSGSGKSTLINMLSGIDHPTLGEVNVSGIPIHTLNEGDMAKWRGRNLGIVFQFFQLLPILTVAENVMLPMDFCNMYQLSKRRDKAVEALDLVGVAPHADKLPGQLSGGEQQRVAIARALANDPPIILADEPTGNLDSKTAAIIFNLFEQLVEAGKTIVMVTHDNDQARRVNRAIIIADGEIIEQYLSHAFPSLTQQQLVWITSQLKPQRFEPGTVIIKKGEVVDKLYIVTKGYVEVVLSAQDGQELVVSKVERNQYFGETALLNRGDSHTTYRAASDTEVEVATLDREVLEKLIAESEETGRQIKQQSEKRENGNH